MSAMSVGAIQDRESAVAVFLGSVNSQEILGLSGRTVFPLINDKVNPCHLPDAAGGAAFGVGLLLWAAGAEETTTLESFTQTSVLLSS
jgi:hypothetical protein